MTKILVMIPAAGGVYDHDCIRSYYYNDPVASVQSYYNMGDLFVYDSSLKLLNFTAVEPLRIAEFDQKAIDRYNAEFDYCFLRGSNYLHPYMKWEQAIPVIQKLKIPVVPFGIGAQAPKTGDIALSEETKYVLQLMADSCQTVGVRGSYTQEILHKLGIKNTSIVGCPTLFRHNNPDLQIKLPPLNQIQTVGYTLRREVSDSYSSSVANYFRIQRDMILQLNERFSLTIMSQGEKQEKAIFYRMDELVPQALKDLVQLKWFQNYTDPMRELYFNQMFYSETVSGYDDIVRKLDLVLGYRLHGNLIALSNGTPAIYCNYDSRTREFAETYKIPSYDVDSNKEFILEDYYRQDLFDQFNRRYKVQYQVMSNFLTSNNMPHKMKQKEAKAALK